MIEEISINACDADSSTYSILESFSRDDIERDTSSMENCSAEVLIFFSDIVSVLRSALSTASGVLSA